MTDNESKDKNKGSWGGHNASGPPDLLNLIKSFFNKTPSFNNHSASKNPTIIVALVALVLVFIWALAGIFIVSPAEQAVILRFGRYVGTDNPGIHWIPPFFETKYKVNIQAVRNFSYQSEMLTKDENIVSVALAVQYQISNPRLFLFNVVNPVDTLQQATSSALRQVVGTMTLNSVLTTGRRQLRTAVAKQLKKILDIYQTGLTVADVTLQPAKPPEAVTAAFDDAIKAREDEQRYINKSKAYSRRVVSIAAGKVARMQQSAEAYQKEVVLAAKGQVARYNALLTPYLIAPGVTRERLYLDTLSSVLKNTTNIIIDSSGNNVLYLPLEKIIQRQLKTAQDKTVNSPSSTKNRPANSNGINSSGLLPAVSGVNYGENRPEYPVDGGDNT